MTDIRRAELADWQGLLAVERACFGDHGYSPYFLRMAPIVLGEHLFVSTRAGELTGYALGAIESADPSRGWLMSVAVTPAARGSGVGERLCREVLASLEAAAAVELWLSVEPSSPAQRLYERLGFEVQHRDESFFGPGQARLLMRSLQVV